MDQLGDTFKQFSGLDASLYGVAFVLAVLLRFARAYWFHFGDAHTLTASVILGMLGVILNLTVTPHPWQFVAWQGISLSVVVMAVEFSLRKMSDKFSWLPSDNQHVSRAVQVAEAHVDAVKEAEKPPNGG